MSSTNPVVPFPNPPKRLVNTVFKPFFDRGHVHATGTKTHQLTLALGCDPSFTASKHFYTDPASGKLTVRAFDAKKGFEFYMAHLSFDTLEDLFEIVKDVQDTPNAMILRGEIKDENPNSKKRRKHDKDGQIADVREVDSAWLMFDLDGLDPDEIEGWDWNNPLSSLDKIFPSLEPGFGAIWQYSSSCKLRPAQVEELDGSFTDKKLKDKDLIRAHVLVLLNRPVANASLKEWIVRENFRFPSEFRFKSDADADKIRRWSDPDIAAKVVAREPITRKVGGIEVEVAIPLDIGGRYDQALCNGVQPHYLTKPTFGAGVADPIPERLFFRSGPPVTLPDWVQTGEQVEAARLEKKKAWEAIKAAREEKQAAQRTLYTRASKIQSGDAWWAHLLAHLSADTRDACRYVASALKTILGTEGIDPYHEWCKSSPAYNSEAWVRQTWADADVTSADIAINTLCARALADADPEDSSIARQIEGLRASARSALAAGNLRESVILEFQHGFTKYHFDLSGTCYRATLEKDEDTGEVTETARQILGHSMIPCASIASQSMDGLNRLAYRLRYRKGTQYASLDIPKGLSHSKSHSQNKAIEMAQAGVTIEAGAAWDLIIALDTWHNTLSDYRNLGSAPTLTSVVKPGWHNGQKAYLNGDVGHGDHEGFELRHDERVSHPASKARGREKGTLEDWLELCRTTYTTPGLRALIAISLAGATVTPLALSTWGIHLYGQGGKGKTTALCVAGSVWGLHDAENASPDEDGSTSNLYGTWLQTPASLERRAMALAGSCVTLDELGVKDRHTSLAETLMMIGMGKGRDRSHADWAGTMSWDATVISSGEKSIASATEGQAQTGVISRYLDIKYDHTTGHWITDAAHAQSCKHAARTVYGVAGNAWIKVLLDPNTLTALKAQHAHWYQWALAQIAGSQEGGLERVCHNLASAMATLTVATKTGILPWSDREIQDVLRWMRDAVKSREVTSQEALAWSMVMEKVRTSATISAEDLGDNKVKTGAYAVYSAQYGGSYTTPTFLGAAIKDLGLNTSKDDLVKWAIGKGLLAPSKSQRLIAGRDSTKRDWMRILEGDDGGAPEPSPIPDWQDLPKIGEDAKPVMSPAPVVETRQETHEEATASAIAPAIAPANASAIAPQPAPATPKVYSIPDKVWVYQTEELEAGKYDRLLEKVRAKYNLDDTDRLTLYLPSPEKRTKTGTPLIVRDGTDTLRAVLQSDWTLQTVTPDWIAEQDLRRIERGTQEEREEELMALLA